MLTATTYYVRFDFLKRQIFENNLIDVIEESFLKYFNEQDKKIYKEAVKTLKEHYFDEKYMNNL